MAPRDRGRLQTIVNGQSHALSILAGRSTTSPLRSPTGGRTDGTSTPKTAAGGLIRKVQKGTRQGIAGRAAGAAAVRPRRAGRPRRPAGRLACRQRQRGAGVHRRQAQGTPQDPRPRTPRPAQGRAAGGLRRRDPQRRHAVPGRFGAGRVAGPRPRRAPPVPPDLQDRARQGRTPADHRRRRRRELERRPPGKLHRHPPARPVRGRSARPDGGASPTILGEVRVVVADWKPMLQRLEAGRKQLELAHGQPHATRRWARRSRSCNGWSRPTSPSWARATSSSRAIPRRATLRPVEGSGLGVLRDAGGAGAAPRQRAGGDDARGAALLLRAGAAHHHQGQRAEPRAPARAHGLYRHQDLPRRRQAEGRDPLRRPVHLAGLRQLAEPDPAAAPQGRDGARGLRLPGGQPRRQGAAQHPGHVPARRAVPDRRQGAAGLERGHPRPGDAAARAPVRPHRPLRPLRLRAASTCRATATHTRVRERIGDAACRGLQGPRRRPSIPTFPRARWCACNSSSAATQGRRRRPTSADLERRIVEIVRTWEDRLADAIAAPRASAPTRCRPSTERRSPPATPRPSRPSGRWRTSSASSAWVPSTRSSIDFYRVPGMPASRIHAAVYSLGRADPAVRARAGAGEPGLLAPSTSAPITSARALPTASATSPCTTWCWRLSDGDAHRARASRQAAGGVLPRRPARARPTTTASIG